jgi:hypothetical protein
MMMPASTGLVGERREESRRRPGGCRYQLLGLDVGQTPCLHKSAESMTSQSRCHQAELLYRDGVLVHPDSWCLVEQLPRRKNVHFISSTRASGFNIAKSESGSAE